jgi:hypothetical protein
MCHSHRRDRRVLVVSPRQDLYVGHGSCGRCGCCTARTRRQHGGPISGLVHLGIRAYRYHKTNQMKKSDEKSRALDVVVADKPPAYIPDMDEKHADGLVSDVYPAQRYAMEDSHFPSSSSSSLTTKDKITY